jgi:hypothetical protein
MNYSAFAIVLGIALVAATPAIVPQLKTPAPVSTQVAGPELVEKLEKNVETKLLSYLRKKDHKKAHFFSRCPSGYEMEFQSVDYTEEGRTIQPAEDGLYYGEIGYYNACDRNKVCEYRINEVTLEVEARYGQTEEFLPAKQWLSTHHVEKGESL